jgi:hypothetical protein
MTANPIDLTTVAAVESWLNQGSSIDATIIQTAITAYSQFVLTMTGRANLNSSESYSETYSGSGGDRLFVRNYPIISVSSLTIGTTNIPQSTAPNLPGWVIDTAGSSAAVALRSGGGSTILSDQWPQRWGAYGNAPPLGWMPYRFFEGIQNIAIAYTAGYNGVPFDLQQGATQLVAAKYRSRQWIEQLSQVQPGVGTTAYSRLAIPVDVQMVLDRYRQRFLTS